MMLNVWAGRLKLSLVFSLQALLAASCTQDMEAEKVNHYLASVAASEYGGEEIDSVPPPLKLPEANYKKDIPRTDYVHGGTPAVSQGGYCGDGIINGFKEQCDKEAIETNCRDLGGLGGVVTCSPRCTLDVSRCLTPVVDQVIGGVAETCKVRCDNTRCRGGCAPTDEPNQSVCLFNCDNDCESSCEGKFHSQIEDCDFRCTCDISAASGAPECDCSIDECEILTSISPNIGLITSKLLFP